MESAHGSSEKGRSQRWEKGRQEGRKKELTQELGEEEHEKERKKAPPLVRGPATRKPATTPAFLFGAVNENISPTRARRCC
jgi:hypothetical protein